MKNVNAQQVVYDLINSGHDIFQIHRTFKDANTLAILGFTEDDAELVEEAYEFLCKLLEDNEEFIKWKTTREVYVTQ